MTVHACTSIVPTVPRHHPQHRSTPSPKGERRWWYCIHSPTILGCLLSTGVDINSRFSEATSTELPHCLIGVCLLCGDMKGLQMGSTTQRWLVASVFAVALPPIVGRPMAAATTGRFPLDDFVSHGYDALLGSPFAATDPGWRASKVSRWLCGLSLSLSPAPPLSLYPSPSSD